ncbi:MAG: hypothetical protein DRI72_08265 [Bacteroidetes bacterium]|nr:MAG: hypothetical protein DRI72_08265 [Bacteroidota bacterium]
MKIITRDQRLVTRAYWMVSHRWLAILVLAAFAWLGKNILNVEIRENTLYLLAIALIIVNLLSLWLLEFITNKKGINLYRSVRFVIHFQLICDLIIITSILHFTGGISNPFFIIYISHMVISSILLTRTGAFIQTTLALLLFGFLVFSEYYGILPHYCLCMEKVINHELYQDPYYVLKTYSVFAFSSYILVYVTTSIGHRLRSQEDKLTVALGQIKYNEELKNKYVLRMAKDILKHEAVIGTNLSILTEKDATQPKENSKRLIESSFRRSQLITNYIKEILYLTSIKLSDNMRKQIISLGDIIVEAISRQYELAEEKDISFELNLDESVDKYYANKTLFENIFKHLISNAIKFSGTKGQITITTKEKLRKIVIEISDKGPGVPKEELKQIFDEYYRAQDVKETEAKGFGIGLALVKEAVKKHDGEIRAVNRPEGGITFIIKLPKQ